MPIKEHKCDQCGLRFETLIRTIEDEKEVSCGCGSKKVTKMLSFHANYTISGDNSASVRPRKSRSNL